MPKSIATVVLSGVGTSGTVFQAGTGEVARYVVWISPSADCAVDWGNGTTWIESFRLPTGGNTFRNPIAVHEGSAPSRLRFRAVTGTISVVVQYIVQT